MMLKSNIFDLNLKFLVLHQDKYINEAKLLIKKRHKYELKRVDFKKISNSAKKYCNQKCIKSYDSEVL